MVMRVAGMPRSDCLPGTHVFKPMAGFRHRGGYAPRPALAARALKGRRATGTPTVPSRPAGAGLALLPHRLPPQSTCRDIRRRSRLANVPMLSAVRLSD
ncbi:hypothetical protein C0L90_05740 [Xanthomonas oryzae pv. oryzae]|nr:hypothetical protein C0L89_05985 [Xanthomonas oryzae pv. oryzae]AVU02080.1 hypothetical protein C0L90_05740 [Xanthomonas oryzae pv. oryzae]